MKNLISYTETHKLDNLTVLFMWEVTNAEDKLNEVVVIGPSTDKGPGKQLCRLHPATLAAVAALSAIVQAEE